VIRIGEGLLSKDAKDVRSLRSLCVSYQQNRQDAGGEAAADSGAERFA